MVMLGVPLIGEVWFQTVWLICCVLGQDAILWAGIDCMQSVFLLKFRKGML